MKTKTNMPSGSRPSPEGTRMLFAGGTVSPMMDDKMATKKPDGRQAKMRVETKPKKARADYNEVVGFC